ncbi:MAG: iron chelate uptake ABC transporter family permease subunit [Pseudomonadales bacterium]|nr:iron chelate uptake ABC transporter family permease subunit [Pseudomonadales bacterium]
MFLNNDGLGWGWNIPSSFALETRLPRIGIAFAAGICMAIAGTLLQRLINNPLASPDLLGVSAGATAAVVISSVMAGKPLLLLSPFIALGGSLTMLAILLLLSRKKQFSAATIILLGISLTAMVEALVQFVLAKGTQDVYSILGWLAGSTYSAQGQEAGLLLIASVVILGFSLLSSRSLTLLNLDREIAAARGLNVQLSSNLLLLLVALSCAMVTATLGPIAFIGLLAPHMAMLMGAHKVKSQLLLSALLGAAILVLADWLGRNMLYPSQVAAGTLAAALGGGYFVLLLLRSKLRAS